ncbi:MAG: GntR family transcriptional regulator [Proteobacteria bacterium]|nr:GntR family transcriptional regulator [Pseudomonadota bacterium]MDA1301198.1 GntR family transcriptional regulator [Pseudomonadota bacterium]
MAIHWNDKEPIYRQLRDRLVAEILEGIFDDGDALPSVRQIAAQHRINPLTVSRAYQLLTEQGLVEMRRGLGMFVEEGARARLRDAERARFLNEEWPAIVEKMRRLGITRADLSWKFT